MRLAYTAIALSIICMQRSESKCFSIMGVSTCTETDLDTKHPFGVAWWFVNVHRRVSLISKICDRVKETFLGSMLEHNAHTSDLWRMTQTDLPARFFLGAVNHLQNNGEYTDLLYDESANANILHESFINHHREIMEYLVELIETADLDDDVRNYAHTYRSYIEQSSVMLQFGFDPASHPLFKLIIQHELRDEELAHEESNLEL